MPAWRQTLNLLSKALLFEKKRKIRSAINFQLKNGILCILLVTYNGAWCAYSVTSFRWPIRESHKWHTFSWPHYKNCGQFLAWKYRKWCWTEWSVSVYRERNVGLASWSNQGTVQIPRFQFVFSLWRRDIDWVREPLCEPNVLSTYLYIKNYIGTQGEDLSTVKVL